MDKIKKLLYLLQLEEYDTPRYHNWLKTNDINLLQERKGKLKQTARIKITFILSLLFSVLCAKEKAVEKANKVVNFFNYFFEKILLFLAKLKIKLFPDLTTIVVTGSYGKTTFKEMLSLCLSNKYSVLKTEGNINTKIGIAKTILKKLNKKHQVFVVEAGAYKLGEIKEICEIVKPKIGVITVIGWMHLERFGSIDKIRQTKFELADYIKDKHNFFSPSINNQFLDFKETIIKIGEILEINSNDILDKLKKFKQPEFRLNKKEINKNIIILEDTYNSNPLGFQKALDELNKYTSHQKIVVTPGMIELGEMQYKLNRQMAQKAVEIADILVIVGETNKDALTIKNKSTKIVYLKRDEPLENIINPLLRPPTVILFENELPDHYF